MPKAELLDPLVLSGATTFHVGVQVEPRDRQCHRQGKELLKAAAQRMRPSRLFYDSTTDLAQSASRSSLARSNAASTPQGQDQKTKITCSWGRSVQVLYEFTSSGSPAGRDEEFILNSEHVQGRGDQFFLLAFARRLLWQLGERERRSLLVARGISCREEDPNPCLQDGHLVANVDGISNLFQMNQIVCCTSLHWARFRQAVLQTLRGFEPSHAAASESAPHTVHLRETCLQLG